MDDAERERLLIACLTDPSASLADRDDAAMYLGPFPSLETLSALLTVASDPNENDLVRASCGESLAEVIDAIRRNLPEPARTEFTARLRAALREP